jgi:hypothetical protein
VAARGTGTLSTSFNIAAATFMTNFTQTFTAPGDSVNCTFQGTSTTTYDSVADFVDENNPIGKLLSRSTATTLQSASGCAQPPSGSVPVTATRQYDSQRRLTKDGTFSYTAWDSSGRPTIGTAPTPPGLCGPQSVTMLYNDAARTITSALTFTDCIIGIQTFTTVITQDTNGTEVSGRTTSSLSSTAYVLQTFTALATGQVCK